MAVAEIVEAVHLVELDHGHDVERVHGCVSPALVEEAAALLQEVEKLQVLRIAPQCERGQLEVVPEVELLEAAALPGHALVLQGHQLDQLGHMVVAERAVGLAYPLLDGAPQGGYGAHVLVERNGEAVGLVASDQLGKRVLADRTRKVDVRVEAQVVVVLERELVAEEEAAEVAAHQVIRDHVAVGHARQRRVEQCEELLLLDGARQPPVTRRQRAELDLGLGAIENGVLELEQKGLVVHYDVRIVEAVVELRFELVDGEEECVEVAVARQYEDARVDAAAEARFFARAQRHRRLAATCRFTTVASDDTPSAAQEELAVGEEHVGEQVEADGGQHPLLASSHRSLVCLFVQHTHAQHNNN